MFVEKLVDVFGLVGSNISGLSVLSILMLLDDCRFKFIFILVVVEGGKGVFIGFSGVNVVVIILFGFVE